MTHPYCGSKNSQALNCFLVDWEIAQKRRAKHLYMAISRPDIFEASAVFAASGCVHAPLGCGQNGFGKNHQEESEGTGGYDRRVFIVRAMIRNMHTTVQGTPGPACCWCCTGMIYGRRPV